MEDLANTVSPLEVVWTLVTLIGATVALRNCWNAQQDLLSLLASGRNGLLQQEQRSTLLIHRVIALSLTTKVMVGILAMLSLPSMDPDGGTSLASQFGPLLMIVSAVALTFLSISLNRNRRIMFDAIRDKYPDADP